MIAKTQYKLSAADLEMLLALVRGGTLAEAGARAGADASTVFRSVQRIEKSLGQRLFERSRRGYLPSEAMLEIARHAERIEAELEAARAAVMRPGEEVSGRVRLTTVDAVLRGIVLPSLPALVARHPLLQLEMRATNELMSLTKRDADLALRAIVPSGKPPEHLIARKLGNMHFVVCASRAMPAGQRRKPLDQLDWIAPDESMPDHPSVRWRRRHLPKVVPRHLMGSILGVVQAVEAGLGVAAVPLAMLAVTPQLVQLGDPLPGCESDLWLLAHPESRHLRRIAAVYDHFANHLHVV